ncbi:leucine-rich repeat-containing protein 4C-like [Panonychus citri]|uniref:leucine-rich repeat-containing protein 4C-like n=1 Tax=Panonychus citri TaxID=50023 RepID=UPI0023081A28|nr:leucine-rich repeat-containing protein 4C-like [Panonychus citri]
MRKLCLIHLLFSSFLIVPCLSNKTNCPEMCECIWRGGKITAECTGGGLIAVPQGVSHTIQVLNISNNNFQTLPSKVFQERGLTNLQKIYLSNCKIGRIFPDAFIQLTNLVELDLSLNVLTNVPSEPLRFINRLRRAIFHANPIQIIGEGSFTGLTHLVHLDLSNCQIDTIAPGAFKELIALEQLKLEGNRITSLPSDSFENLPLSNIGLHQNPWNCDCSLRPILEWLGKSKLTPNVPPTCSRPSKLKGLMWNSLALADFACPPVFKVGDTELKTTIGTNLSLICTVESSPLAKVYWSYEDLDNTTNTTLLYISENDKYKVSEDTTHDSISSTLIVPNVDSVDARRHFLCTAENQADSTTKNFTIAIVSAPLANFSDWSRVEIAGAIIAFLLGLILTLVMVAIWLMKSKKESSSSVKKQEIKSTTIGSPINNKSDGGNNGSINNSPVLLYKNYENYENFAYHQQFINQQQHVSPPLQLLDQQHQQSQLFDPQSQFTSMNHQQQQQQHPHLQLIDNQHAHLQLLDQQQQGQHCQIQLIDPQQQQQPHPQIEMMGQQHHPQPHQFHHYTYIGQESFRYSPDEGYAEDQVYISEGTEV